MEERRLLLSFPAGDTVNYVVSRQNGDGGYSFCQGTESNLQDTYYGLAILNLLKMPLPNVEQTIKWLNQFPVSNLHSLRYAAKALGLCGQNPGIVGGKFLQYSKTLLEAIDVRLWVAEFKVIYMITELVNTLCAQIEREEISRCLTSYQNEDGGFGVQGYSDLTSTYYATMSLFNIGHSARTLRGALGYARSCEKPLGGFTIVPDSSPPHMEHVYHGISILSLFDEHMRYPEETGRFVLRCRNQNGGFARSEIGISTFEDTFYAISALQGIVTTKQSLIHLQICDAGDKSDD